MFKTFPKVLKLVLSKDKLCIVTFQFLLGFENENKGVIDEDKRYVVVFRKPEKLVHRRMFEVHLFFFLTISVNENNLVRNC